MEFVRLLNRLRRAARNLRLDALVLWLAARDPRTPWGARVVCAVSAAYVFSPIQLLPDFIPVVGYLDDALVLALGGWLAIKLIPKDLAAELRLKAREMSQQPISLAGALIVVLIWVGLGALALVAVWPMISAPSMRLP